MNKKNYLLNSSKISSSYAKLRSQYDFEIIRKLIEENLICGCYLYGGYIRDTLLDNKPEDIDFKAISQPNNFSNQVKKIRSVISKSINQYKFASLSDNSVLFRWYVRHKKTKRPIRVDLVLISYFPLEKIKSGILPPKIRTNYSVNSFYFDVISEDLYGFYNSERDLNNKNIRLVDPENDLVAQPMLLFRGVYLASKLPGFKIKNNTLSYIKKDSKLAAGLLGQFSTPKDTFILKIYSSSIFKGLKFDPDKYFKLMNETKLNKQLEDYIKKKAETQQKIIDKARAKTILDR